MRSLRAPVAAVLLLTLGLSCSSPTEAPRLSSITLNATAVTIDAISGTQQVVATPRDEDGQPIQGITVTWAVAGATVAAVSNTGLVTALANGTTQLTASSGSVNASIPVTVQQFPVAPVIVAGDAQAAPVGTQLAQPVTVRVTDRLGNAMAGQSVSFVVQSGGGSVSAAFVNSAADGTASTLWTLGNTTALQQRLSIVAGGLSPVTLVTATALAGPPATLVASALTPTTGQTAVVGTAVERRPAVVVRDAGGNGVVGTTVRFAVVGGGGSVGDTSAITDNFGVATVSAWTLGATLGDNVLRASIGALPPVDFTARGVANVCTADGAHVITPGMTLAGTISATDCITSSGDIVNFDYYRFELAAETSVIIEMDGASTVDAWLTLYDANTLTKITENDDIILGVNTDSRIGIRLLPGAYLIQARTFEANQFGAYTLSLREAAGGVPTEVAVIAGQLQRAAPGLAPVAPRIVVRDEAGVGVPGIQVTFAVVPGVGAIAGENAVTDANGEAAVGSWTLAAGANVLSATIPGTGIANNPAVISASGKVGSATAGYDITLRFANMPTLTQLNAFSAAATRWEGIITGDLTAQAHGASIAANCGLPWLEGLTVDDIVIDVNLRLIDGPGSVLGSAGPCAIRSANQLTSAGVMNFDTADLAGLEASGRFTSVILHEMGHVLGIGTLWSLKGLLADPSSSTTQNDTRFTGPNALAVFETIGGAAYMGAKVPVENTGGGGTINSHWRESVFNGELMTGFINAPPSINPLSVVTIQSLADLGYTVTNAGADTYTLGASLMDATVASTAPRIELKDDIWNGPRIRVDARGQPVGMRTVRKSPKPVR